MDKNPTFFNILYQIQAIWLNLFPPQLHTEYFFFKKD